MSSCSSLLLCFLLLQIQVIVQTTCASKACPPSSCGEITNISYPFRLKDDPAACGKPAYELTCEKNRTLLLSLFPDKKEYYYHVKAINYNNGTVRVVDPGIHDGDCSSVPRYFLSRPNFTSTYDYSYHNDPYTPVFFYFEHVSYLKCSNPVRDNSRYVDTAPCPPLLNNNYSKGGHVYAVFGDLPAGGLNVDCHVLLVVPTSFINEADTLINYEAFSYEEIHRMLVYGFQVSWSFSEDFICTSPLGIHFRCGSPLQPNWLTFVEVIHPLSQTLQERNSRDEKRKPLLRSVVGGSCQRDQGTVGEQQRIEKPIEKRIENSRERRER